MTAKTTEAAPADSRLRAVAAQPGNPIVRTLKLLIGNNGPAVIELAAMREHLRLGTAPVDGAGVRPRTAQSPAASE
jgi:hypothetical protein